LTNTLEPGEPIPWLCGAIVASFKKGCKQMENNYKKLRQEVCEIPSYVPVRVNYNGYNKLTATVSEYNNGNKLRSSYPRQMQYDLDGNALLAVKDAFKKWEGKFLIDPEVKAMCSTREGFIFLVGNKRAR